MDELIWDKYKVTKRLGETDPEAEYFVLRIDKDDYQGACARRAIMKYVSLMAEREPQYAKNVIDLVFKNINKIKDKTDD